MQRKPVMPLDFDEHQSWGFHHLLFSIRKVARLFQYHPTIYHWNVNVVRHCVSLCKHFLGPTKKFSWAVFFLFKKLKPDCTYSVISLDAIKTYYPSETFWEHLTGASSISHYSTYHCVVVSRGFGVMHWGLWHTQNRFYFLSNSLICMLIFLEAFM